MRVVVFHGIAQERERMKKVFTLGSYDICVTTYEQLTSEEGFFHRIKWGFLVLDEGKFTY